MRSIVTGGAGFIGSHVVDALLKQGAEVVVVDDLRRGSADNLPLGVELHDVPVEQFNWGLIGPTDVVFHLAARVTNIAANRKDHLGMLQKNLSANMAVIEGLRRHRPRLFVAVSTVCVYPHDAPVPTPESAGYPFHPEPTNEGYGLAKAVLEKQAQYLRDELGVPTVVPRFSNAIGLRDYYDWESSHVVPALIRKFHEHEDVAVWGTGQQSRTFVDARDIAKALLLLAETPAAHDGRPVNIGPDRSITIADLVQLVQEACGTDKPFRFDRSKPDGHKKRAVDNTRLRGLIGWVPDYPLEQSIADMVEDYRARHRPNV